VLWQKPECGTPLTQGMNSIDYSKSYLFINLLNLLTYHYTRGAPIFPEIQKKTPENFWTPAA
jgi:hypothetical protein